MDCWAEWAKYGFMEGFSNIYKSWTDYLPLFHYVLFFFGKIQGSVEAIEANIHALKTVSILFEFGTTLFLFKILEKKYKDTYKAMLFSLFYFLNIAVLLNGMIWGQVDGIMTFFIFGAVIFAWNKRIFLSLLFFLLALNMKLQAIIFSPILFLLLLPLIWDKSQLKKTVFSFLGIALIQFLIFLPFIYAGDFPKLWNVITGSVGKYPKVSMAAYNMWYFFIKVPMETFDNNKFWGITYKNWGLALFFVTSFFALLHFVKPLFQQILKKANIAYSFRKTIISCALIPLLFFFFNTQMHERYFHPALIFLALYALLYNRPFVFVLGSVACFLNMEDVLQFFQWGNYGTLVFTPWFIACLYLLLIIILFLDLYDVNFKKKHKTLHEKRSFHYHPGLQ
ncbi:MAG: hypothetical protein LBV02_02170 [Bacteroidales bacterium]|nr:hypothetical protein [Bacteroidales bacterium]